MGWERRETKIAHHFEFLSEDGTFLGYVLQFNPKEPFWAHTPKTVIEKFSSMGEAKDAVESMT